MNLICSFLMFVGRLCFSVLFIMAGVHKLMDIAGTTAHMATKNIPANPYLYAAIAVEILGGLSLLFGYKTRFGALILALFLISVTYIFHDFWNVADPMEKQMQLGHFFSNVAIFGGLLYIVCCGAGRCSLDRRCCHVKPPETT